MVKKIKKKIIPKKKIPAVLGCNMDRVSTGVPGLDKLIHGGYPKGSSVLISGGTGTGKTTFSLQYLWDGLQKGESCVFISLEETTQEIKNDALGFGWDLEPYIKSGKFTIVERNVFENPNIDFFEIDKVKAKRVIIDSISILSLVIEDKASMRSKLQEMIKSLKARDTTVLLISERVGAGLSRLDIEEFVADGVVVLDFTPVGPQAGRNLFIRKMRCTNHSEDVHPITIGKNGIKVLSV